MRENGAPPMLRKILLLLVATGVLALGLAGAADVVAPNAAARAHAEQKDAPPKTELMVIPLEKGTEFIRTWYICGPFPRAGSGDLRRRWADPKASPKPEREAFTRERYRAKNRPGRLANEHDRRHQDAIGRSIDQEDPSPEHANHQLSSGFPPTRPPAPVPYALAFVSLPAPRTYSLYSGSDDGISVWLNGRLIHHFAMDRPIVPDEDFMIARFRKGLNTLLVEVTNTNGYWGFMMRIAGGDKPAPLSLPIDLKVN